ncbi:polysaccharide lyase beta-sandwich domain-containing protein, partial [Streptomyces xiamenensis]|uniref:polysaccharide lyase beta-sandwich domain-containing protein n=1 Tax=Streptomyces xiamenensis TaxID=408015 RepID=UPI0035DEA603
DDEIVILTADVHDPAGRPLTTTLDTRITNPASPMTLEEGPGWLHCTGPDFSIGYLFLTDTTPTARLTTVTNSRRLIRTANPDTPVTKQVFTLSQEHPPTPHPHSLAYALLPNATRAQVASYGDSPLTLLSNTPHLQAVEHQGLSLLMANTFTPGPHQAGPLTIEGPASVLLHTTPDGTLSMAISDPTTKRDTVTVLLRGYRLDVVSADDDVHVRRLSTGTRLTADTRSLNGRSVTASLH